ncbi:MAG: zinc-binding dehydrogenase [Lapillicoccus sp.]
MRAAYLHGFGDLRVEQVPDPSPGPGEVLLAVACVQPSVTEAMLMAGEPVATHDALVRRLAGGPVAFGGHEFCGVVAGAGHGVDAAIGTPVTAVETAPCLDCRACRSGRLHQCPRPDVLGFTRAGAFAELVVVPAATVVRIPEGVDDSAAAAVQPLAGAIHAHAAAAVAPGESVLVIGAGVMGLLAVQVARRGNAGLLIVAARSPEKAALAERFGADVVLTGEADVAARVRDLTDGVGVDVVVETAGGATSAGLAGSSTVATAADALARGGRIVMVSVLPDDARLPLARLRERGVTLLHPRSGAGGYSPSSSVFEQAMRLVARGDVDLHALVTHRFAGLDALPAAVAVTRGKHAYGALGPAQVVLGGVWTGQTAPRQPTDAPEVLAR